LVKDLK